jgi:hypothetical protein
MNTIHRNFIYIISKTIYQAQFKRKLENGLITENQKAKFLKTITGIVTHSESSFSKKNTYNEKQFY